ncbi:MFS transporter [Amycolatopsis sp. NPDC051372]|uniref:MFS transporter n=1 Tax=Amycolatopsis sp. NPDC051372 TaxID=3155669 RepID=UPI0034252B5B
MADSLHPPRQSMRRVVLASLIGNALEWYDFFLYGTAAAIVFNKLFFPAVDPIAGTIAAFGTYALGFAARPIGGIIFGHFGDRIGRRAMLVTTLTLMGLTTALVGVLPTYQQIGLWAPILLTVLRIVQGIAVGGEWGGGVLLISENADPKRRGMQTALGQSGVSIGFVLSAAVFALLSGTTSTEAFQSWGWRIPFLVGVVLMVVGLVIRMNVLETRSFAQVQRRHETERFPVLAAIRKHPRAVVVSFGARLAENGGSYIFLVFVLTYASHIGIPQWVTLVGVILGELLEAFTMPLWGALSDRVGRRPVYLGGAIAMIVWAVPFFALLHTRETWLVWLAVVVANAACHSAMIGVQASFFSELFGSGVRYSGVALGHELASVLAGGLSPLIATVLLAWSGSWWPVAAYLGLLGLLTVAALAWAPETRVRDLDAVGQPEPAQPASELAR